MVHPEALLASRPVQIIGVLVIFAVVYAILYRPVLRMLGERPKGERESAGTVRAVEAEGDGPPSTQGVSEAIAAGPATRTPWYRDRLLPLTIASVLILDQLTKNLIKANLALYESWPNHGIVRLTHGINTGTAFGLLPNQTAGLIVVSIFAIGFLFYFYKSQALTNRLLRLAIGLQLGGALGNLIDRLRDGAVTDFIDIGWWPIFNLADSSIIVGLGLLIAAALFSKEPEPVHQRDDNKVGPEE